MAQKTIVDPPSGWKYGFPKVYDNPNNLTMEEWLIENGYPKNEFDKDGKVHWIRTWKEEDENIN